MENTLSGRVQQVPGQSAIGARAKCNWCLGKVQHLPCIKCEEFNSRWNLNCILKVLMSRAHSFPRQNLVNSVAHRGKADEIPRLTAVTQLNFRGLINHESAGQIHVMNL